MPTNRRCSSAMCQLLSMNCNNTASIQFSFTGFSERGGHTSDHVDGWGIAFYEPTGSRLFIDDKPAYESPLARFVKGYEIKSKTVVAHIRKATQGEVGLANCHPFQREWLGQTWFFANNGDLRNYYPELSGPYFPIGSTDSERAFCYLMQVLSRAFKDCVRPPAWTEVAEVLFEAIAPITRHGNFNFTLTNGDALFVHCSSSLYEVNRQHPFPKARLVDVDVEMDLSAVNGTNDRMVVVATEPLTVDEPWTALQTGELRVYVGGELAHARVNPGVERFPVPTVSVGRRPSL
uniref:Putative glutamine amidotransferase HI1037 n=1 Tax=Curvibacter symbiont subsp. Hydra magnipapillata TaxID=667019 RepID=C9YH78_CURXX|nr:Putative glutamine amidotransferase HI1037 [Curvibacter putative symbiont of Hydra magnipapillata]